VPAAFIHPCQPIVAKQPPTGPGWAHELKHDGYRLQIHIRDGVAKFSRTNFAGSFANLIIICCVSLWCFPKLALARDINGKYAISPLKQWFDSLASRRGPCCSAADGQKVEDVDWDSKDGKYRVRLDGQWIEVPPDTLVTVPNKFGPAVVWPYKDYEGRTQIRCFIPGAGG